MNIIENEILKIKSINKGGELCSIYSKINNTEYLWQADLLHWGRHAPILFPVIGCCKNNQIRINSKSYRMPPHGFARDAEFQTIAKTKDSIKYSLKSNNETKKMYPFDFELFISYKLTDNVINVEYTVNNPSDRQIYFSIGAHPGFNCPLSDHLSKEDYYIKFSSKETLQRYFIRNDLIDRTAEPCLDNSDRIDINKTTFDEGALIFKDYKSDKISLKTDKDSKGVGIEGKGYTHLGIWSASDNARFVCIEPWFGCSDYHDFDGDFSQKEGVLTLAAKDSFSCSYKIIID